MAETPDDDRYVTSAQLALELGVHIQTVQRYFREEGLPGRKIGHEWRTTRAAWEWWLEGGEAGPRTSRQASAHPATLVESSTIDLERKGGDVRAVQDPGL